MYSIVLAAFLTPAYEAPALGRRHGCRGGRMVYSTGCYGCGGGCYGWGGCYGCGGGSYGCGGGCYGCGGGCCGGGGGGVVYPSMSGSGMGSSGTTSSETEVKETLQALKKSVEEVKKEQAKIHLEQLKQTAEELRLKTIEQQIGEIRRNLDGLNRKPRAVPLPMPVPLPAPKSTPELPAPRPGKVMLEIPADAILIVNDKPVPAGSVFLTPVLEPGKDYVYEFEAALVRDGESVNRVKRVVVRAGQVVRLAYEDMEAPQTKVVELTETTKTPAHVTVRLPADARLSVQGVDCPLPSDTRTFDTPALASGQEYFYVLKAEVTRNGRPITQTRRVAFRAGERVTVSFENLVVSNRNVR